MSSTRRDIIVGVGAIAVGSALPALPAAGTAKPVLIAAIWFPAVIPVGTVLDYVYRCGLAGATFAQPVVVVASEPSGEGMYIHDTESCGERRAVAEGTRCSRQDGSDEHHRESRRMDPWPCSPVDARRRYQRASAVTALHGGVKRHRVD